MDEAELTFTDNSQAGQYEAFLDGARVGLATYSRRGSAVAIPHTETLPAFGGRGFAGRLVRFALDDIRSQGLTVIPACPFVESFIERNPEYRDLLA